MNNLFFILIVINHFFKKNMSTKIDEISFIQLSCELKHNDDMTGKSNGYAFN